MNEKYAVGLAIMSVLAVTMFLSRERMNSQEIIDAKKAAYQQEILSKNASDLQGQK